MDTGMENSIAIDAQAAIELQQKYAQEREKRIRTDGLAQYVKLSTIDKLTHFKEDPWLDPQALEFEPPALEDGSRCKFLSIGAGYGGLTFAVKLIQAGISVLDIRMVDTAGGFGGTWYWDRYAHGPELRAYANKIAEKYQLVDKASLSTATRTATWDDLGNEWVVELEMKGSPMTVRSQFVILAGGVLSMPKVPNLPGLQDFAGHTFHTSRWDYSCTGGSPTDPVMNRLKDKRVGIIGTGATAIQVVPELAKCAKELYVFQRTPTSCDRRDNRRTDPTNWKTKIATKKGWQRERMENFNAVVQGEPGVTTNFVDDGFSNMPSYKGLIGGPNNLFSPEQLPDYIASLQAVDMSRNLRIHSRVDSIVKDPAVAAKLKHYYSGWCKRPCFHDEYLQSFNRPNVHLIDTDGKGLSKLTSSGAVFGDKEFPLNVLIFSTGYELSAAKGPAGGAGIKVLGRDGYSLDQKWIDGIGTVHGVTTHSFPNLFLSAGRNIGATANYNFMIDQTSTHTAYIATEAAPMAKSEKFTIEPSKEAEEVYVKQIMKGALVFAAMAGCTPGYLNTEGRADHLSPDEQKKASRGAGWGQGANDYAKMIERWRAQGGLEGLEVKAY